MGAKMDKVVPVFCFEVDVDTTQTEPIRTGYLGGRQGILTGTLETCGSEFTKGDRCGAEVCPVLS